MSKTRIFITPQLIHSTALMVLLGYIDYHPSLASCATPDPTYHHLPTTFHHQPINFDQGWHKRSEEHTSELQSHSDLVCRLLLETKTNRHPDCISYNPLNRNLVPPHDDGGNL